MGFLDNLVITRKMFGFLCSQHLGAIPPESGDFQEMVCQACMKRCSFLWAYAAHLAGKCLCGVGIPPTCAVCSEQFVCSVHNFYQLVLTGLC